MIAPLLHPDFTHHYWECPTCGRARAFNITLDSGRHCHGWEVVIYQGAFIEKGGSIRGKRATFRRRLSKWLPIVGREHKEEFEREVGDEQLRVSREHRAEAVSAKRANGGN